MASKQEIEKELKKALSEIGVIKPWFDKNVQCWVFSHPLYPVEYGGDSLEEVIKGYPLYLREFIAHRLDAKLASHIEKKTKGHGGHRLGAGRPKGTTKEETQRISLPQDIAIWIKEKVHWPQVRTLISRERTKHA